MLFVSSQFYALGKQLGIARAMRTINQQVENPSRDSLPAVRTIARLNAIEPVQLRADTAATCIAKTRSRAFHDALMASDADVWIAIDDDVEASTETLRHMLEAVRTSDGICIVPMLLRPASSDHPMRLNVDLQRYQLDVPRVLPSGGRVVRGLYGGFGLVAMSKHAMIEIGAANSSEIWDDDDGVAKLALFREDLHQRKWYGEDISFFMRVPTNVRIEILITGHTCHSNEPLDLADVVAYLRREDTVPNVEAPPDTQRNAVR